MQGVNCPNTGRTFKNKGGVRNRVFGAFVVHSYNMFGWKTNEATYLGRMMPRFSA